MIPQERSRISLSKILLVEGKGPQALFEGLLGSIGLNEEIDVRSYGGNPQLHGYLAALKAAPGFRSVKALGIVRDAETDAAGAFASVRLGLSKSGFHLPRSPHLVAIGEPNISIFILPDCQSEGMIETLLMRETAETSVYACVEGYFRCLEEAGINELRNRDKAMFQAFLASRPYPGLSLELSVRRGYIDFSSPGFDPLRNFLESLYR